MALQKQIWIQDIQENLFANNAFMKMVGVDDSQYVDYLTVHVPQAGSNPGVSKNRSQFPAQVSQRTDNDLTYNLNQFTTDPILVTKLDALQVSYDKRKSLLKQHIDKVSNAIANNTLYNWAPTVTSSANVTRIIRTSGTAGATLAPGATGTRNAITLADISAAVGQLDNDNIDPEDERFLIMPATMYWKDFVNISTLQKYLEYGSATLPSGKVPMIFGCKVLIRSSVLQYDSSATIKPINDDGTVTTPATTDELGCLVVSASYVRKALGTIDVFYAEKRPEWYGDILSTLVMQGGTIGRTNLEGVMAIVQQ